MSSILLSQVRIKGFRGLDNVEVNLDPVSVLIGMNNSGKTSFLKALQVALGNRQFVSQDDFNIVGNLAGDKIIIDIKIIPFDYETNISSDLFEEDWEIKFTENRIIIDNEGKSFVPVRTLLFFNELTNSFQTKQFILSEWPAWENEEKAFWYSSDNGNERSFNFEEIPFFYVDAQRDILEDLKAKTSYLGRMISKIEYSPEDIKNIEDQIGELNESVVLKSEILTNIKSTLIELNTALSSSSDGVEITPFTKKIRDLNKGLAIYYRDHENSFSMEYHGMGTRSWSSLLTLKSFIQLLQSNSLKEKSLFFPILAIEEPEAHLHPNAQKRLYNQISTISGQKIISTHSTYISASANLSELRSFYKDKEIVKCGQVTMSNLDAEAIRKIERQVINTRGELFFSKALVFFEGETEEQVLPELSDIFFGKSSMELGIDYIGVAGSGNYLPFIRIAESFKIPWFIFSDGEESTIKAVTKAISELHNKQVKDIDINTYSNILIIENFSDFEKSLIDDGYSEQIKEALVNLHSKEYLANFIKTRNGTRAKSIKTDEACVTCKQIISVDLFRDYSNDDGALRALYDCMTSQKTQFGPQIASVLVKNKLYPKKVHELFIQIDSILNNKKVKPQ